MATSSGEQQLYDPRLRMPAGGTHAGSRHEYWPGNAVANVCDALPRTADASYWRSGSEASLRC